MAFAIQCAILNAHSYIQPQKAWGWCSTKCNEFVHFTSMETGNYGEKKSLSLWCYHSFFLFLFSLFEFSLHICCSHTIVVLFVVVVSCKWTSRQQIYCVHRGFKWWICLYPPLLQRLFCVSRVPVKICYFNICDLAPMYTHSNVQTKH